MTQKNASTVSAVSLFLDCEGLISASTSNFRFFYDANIFKYFYFLKIKIIFIITATLKYLFYKNTCEQNHRKTGEKDKGRDKRKLRGDRVEGLRS